MKKELKVKSIALSLVYLCVFMGMYSLFLTRVGERDYYYQIKNNKLELAKGFCWKKSLKEFQLEHHFVTSFEIFPFGEKKPVKVVLIGNYSLASEKKSLAQLLDNVKLSSYYNDWPLCSIDNLQAHTSQCAIDWVVAERVKHTFTSMTVGLLVAPNYVEAINGAVNEIIPKYGIDRVKFSSMSLEFTPDVAEMVKTYRLPKVKN